MAGSDSSSIIEPSSATRRTFASPSALSALIPIQFTSTSYHARLWRRSRMGMMVVMPSFAKAEQRNPPVIA